MNVDTAAVRKIKEARAAADPVIVHDPTKSWYDSESPPSEEEITDARLALIDDYPIDEPIPKATWPEVVAYCFTASMDAAAINQEFVLVYRYAMKQYLTTCLGVEDADAMLPSPLTGDDEMTHPGERITDDIRETAEQLRRKIKSDLDEAFIREGYDELPFDPEVPKAFWKDASVSVATEDTGDDEQLDGETAQAGLDMF